MKLRVAQLRIDALFVVVTVDAAAAITTITARCLMSLSLHLMTEDSPQLTLGH